MRKSQTRYEAVLINLGKAIYDRRMALNYSQQDLADLSDLHRTYISDIERGARNLTVTSLGRVAAALKTTSSKLFEKAEAARRKSKSKDSSR